MEGSNKLDNSEVHDNTSTDNASAVYPMTFPTTDGTRPTIQQSLTQLEGDIVDIDRKSFKCIVRIGKERPPTSVAGQGRHVSAYALLLQVVRSRFEGKYTNNLVDEAKKLLLEYCVENEELNLHFEELDRLSVEFGPRTSDYEARINIFRFDSAAQAFTKSEATKKGIKKLKADGNHTEMIELFKTMKSALESRDKIGTTSMDVRNLIKIAQEAYSPLVSCVVAKTVAVLNGMKLLALDFSQPSAEEKRKIPIGEETAIKRLSTGSESYRLESKELDFTKIAKDMAALFDYKYEKVITLNEESHIQRRDLYRVANRHVKMVYDSFDFMRELMEKSEKSAKLIMTCFAKEILESEGWKNCQDVTGDFGSAEKLRDRMLRYNEIKFEKNVCSVTEKFEVKKIYGSVVKNSRLSRGEGDDRESF